MESTLFSRLIVFNYIGVDTYQSSCDTQLHWRNTNLVSFLAVVSPFALLLLNWNQHLSVFSCYFNYIGVDNCQSTLSIFLFNFHYIGVNICQSSCITLTILQSTLSVLLYYFNHIAFDSYQFSSSLNHFVKFHYIMQKIIQGKEIAIKRRARLLA